MNPDLIPWDTFFASLSPRAKSAMRAQGIESFDSLEAYRFSDLMALPLVGKTTANEIEVKLSKAGRSLAASQVVRPSMDFVARETAKVNDQVHQALQALTFKLPLRDMFAMAATAGMLGNPVLVGNGEKGVLFDAEMAYKVADAMMAVRGRSGRRPHARHHREY